MDDDVSIGRRLSAARRGAGIETRKELTDAVDLPNLGPGTLGRVERGERHLFPHEAEAFARVLGIDIGYLYNAPEANGPIDERLDRIEEGIAGIAATIQAITDVLGLTGPDATTDALAKARDMTRRLAEETRRSHGESPSPDQADQAPRRQQQR